MTDLHVFIDENDVDYFIAEDSAHAKALWAEHYVADAANAPAFVQLADLNRFTLFSGYGTYSQTCREWAVENGPGFFASTEY